MVCRMLPAYQGSYRVLNISHLDMRNNTLALCCEYFKLKSSSDIKKKNAQGLFHWIRRPLV